MPLDPGGAAAEIERQLRAIGTAERAAGEKRYLKSELDHLGATVWQNRRTVRSFVKQHPAFRYGELISVSRALWATGIFDCRLDWDLRLSLGGGVAARRLSGAREPERSLVPEDTRA